MEAIATIMMAVMSAVVYAIIAYAKTQNENFDSLKFLSTIIIGVCVGIMFVMSNTPITQQTIEVQLVAYAGTTALVENVLKLIYRKIIKK